MFPQVKGILVPFRLIFVFKAIAAVLAAVLLFHLMHSISNQYVLIFTIIKSTLTANHSWSQTSSAFWDNTRKYKRQLFSVLSDVSR